MDSVFNGIIAASRKFPKTVTRNEFRYFPGQSPSLAQFQSDRAVQNPGFTLINGSKVGDSIFFDNTGWFADGFANTGLKYVACLAVQIYPNAFRDNNGLTHALCPNVLYIGQNAFNSCFSLVSIYFPILDQVYINGFLFTGSLGRVHLPNVTYVGPQTFSGTGFRIIYLPSLTTLGAGVNDNSVFFTTSPYRITLTIPAIFMTNNGGAPHASVQYLMDHNNVTVVTV